MLCRDAGLRNVLNSMSCAGMQCGEIYVIFNVLCEDAGLGNLLYSVSCAGMQRNTDIQ